MKGTNRQKQKRAQRARSKIVGTNVRPRLCVSRSNKGIAAQLINDVEGKTILTVTQTHLDKKATGPKTDIARSLGTLVAEKAKEMKVKEVIFDKGPYAYHGRIKALAEGAREGGLSF